MSSDEKLVAKPLYDYGQFKICELCSSSPNAEEIKPKPNSIKEGAKINIRGPRKVRIGGKLNIKLT